MYTIAFLLFIHTLVITSAQYTPIYNCTTLASGKYIISADFEATSSPCIVIQGNNVELYGDSRVITGTTSTSIGIDIRGTGHQVHDIKLSNFGVGIDLYSSNTSLYNVGIDVSTQTISIGIRGTASVGLELENIDIAATKGTFVGLQLNGCRGFYVYDYGLMSSAESTTGIQILYSSDGFFFAYSVIEYCNPTGIEISRSSNIRFVAGSNFISGCATDTTDTIAYSIKESSDILFSNIDSVAVEGPRMTAAVHAVSSKYIGARGSNFELRSAGAQGAGAIVIWLSGTIGFTIDVSTLAGFYSTGVSIGMRVERYSQLGVQLSRVQTVTVGVDVDTTSDFYSNSLESTAVTTYNFQQDAGLCSNAVLNSNANSTCYPPSNDSCCDTTCSRNIATCNSPTVTNVLGIPFDASGGFVTILGSDFGDNYYDTVVTFNDTLCLIHYRNEELIVCWLTGDTFFQLSSNVTLVNGWNTYNPPVTAIHYCDQYVACPSNYICYNYQCVKPTNDTVIPGQPLIIVINLGNGNTGTLTIPADTFPAGSNVQTLSKAISEFAGAPELVRVVDFEFRVFDLGGQLVQGYGSGVSFSFSGPDVRSNEQLYTISSSNPQLVGTGLWSAGNLAFTVTQGGDGIFVLMAPAPVIQSITSTPTQGGRVVITGSNFGTSGANMIAHVFGPTVSIYCPLHVNTALVTDSRLECNLPAGVGHQLNFAISFTFPSSSTTLTSVFSFEAPSISAITPNRALVTTELPGLVITVTGSNFGPSNGNRPLAPIFAPSLSGRSCTAVSFLIPHQQFTCVLGPRGLDPAFQLEVGDFNSFSSRANYTLTFTSSGLATSLVVGAPTTVLPCARFSINVSVVDELGLPAVNPSSLSFSSSDPLATLPSGLNSATTVFNNLILVTPGTQTITVTLNTLTASATIMVPEDTTGVCRIGCNGVFGSGLVNDSCGVCGGDNSTCLIGCDGVAGSGRVNDSCGVCGGDNSTCPLGCDGVLGSGLVNDSCGVCGGDNSTCLLGCDGVAGSGLVNDSCGVCGGNNTCAIPPPVGRDDDDDDHKGAIIGGVIGGFFGLLLVAALIAFLIRRHRQHQQPPPADFAVTGAAPGNNVKFGIAELGTGYGIRGLDSPNLGRPPITPTPSTEMPPAALEPNAAGPSLQ